MNLPTKSLPRSLIRCAFICALGIVAGCNVVPPAQDDPTRYYILSDSAPAAPQGGPSQGGLRIGLKTVRLEGYLRHREMVVRTAANEVEFRDFRRWAEPLDAAIAHILQSRLLASPAVSQAWVEPFPVDQDRDFEVSIAVTRCEGTATRSGDYVASLSAMVEISTSGANGHVVARKLFVAPDAAWNGTNFDRLAALLSADVASLAQEVLAAVPARS
jgi:uncharacterized lipoprotein YmbA